MTKKEVTDSWSTRLKAAARRFGPLLLVLGIIALFGLPILLVLKGDGDGTPEQKAQNTDFSQLTNPDVVDYTSSLTGAVKDNVLPEKAATAVKSLSEAVARVRDNSRTGRLLFTRPTSMKVDREYYVTLRVTKDRSVDLSEDLEGILENRKVKVAAIMTATLKGGKAFNIQPLSSEEQALQENEYTEWEWQVTPREGGLHLLTITVARKVDTDLGPGFKDERVLEEKFSVTITPAERIKKFAAGNWQWLWGVITAPPIILLTAYKRARGRKSTNTGTREQVDAQPANEGP